MLSNTRCDITSTGVLGSAARAARFPSDGKRIGPPAQPIFLRVIEYRAVLRRGSEVRHRRRCVDDLCERNVIVGRIELGRRTVELHRPAVRDLIRCGRRLGNHLPGVQKLRRQLRPLHAVDDDERIRRARTTRALCVRGGRARHHHQHRCTCRSNQCSHNTPPRLRPHQMFHTFSDSRRSLRKGRRRHPARTRTLPRAQQHIRVIAALDAARENPRIAVELYRAPQTAPAKPESDIPWHRHDEDEAGE